MQVDKRDEIASKSLIEILGKAKYELVGNEAIVVARVMEWAVGLNRRIVEDLNPKPVIQQQPAAVIEQPKVKTKKGK